MPRPCAVESHARGYKNRTAEIMRCHGLAPWSLTLVATTKNRRNHEMPRPCAVESHARCSCKWRRSFSRKREPPRHETMPSTKRAQLFCSGERETPRHEAVASCESLRVFFVAASVRLHGARRWHHTSLCESFCSGERETPRRKAVASYES